MKLLEIPHAFRKDEDIFKKINELLNKVRNSKKTTTPKDFGPFSDN